MILVDAHKMLLVYRNKVINSILPTQYYPK